MIHKAIKGFEDYLVTDTGRVYSLKSQKYLKQIYNRDAYLLVHLLKDGKAYTKTVHRLVAQAFIENIENLVEVDHINRVRDDNRVENLRWANRKSQMKNLDRTNNIKSIKKNRGKTIVEVINDEVSIGFRTINEVPNITPISISNHTRKGETEFIVKQKNGNIRHFIVPKQK